MAKSEQEMVASILQMRAFAAEHREEKELFARLEEMLSTPIPRGARGKQRMKAMYNAAILALTEEISPPSKSDYAKVIERLNKALAKDKLGDVHIEEFADDGKSADLARIGCQRRSKSDPLSAQIDGVNLTHLGSCGQAVAGAFFAV